jgi:16S rRNA (guanine966-N2)-methyltransferase
MRIIAGLHRGLMLESPADEAIRPTSDRARQALFNILEHRFGLGEASPLHEARVLDVFCGSGAMGLEALSRGAAQCTFIDNSATAIALAERNARRANEFARCRFVRRDATKLERAPAPATLAFLDPPYQDNLAMPTLDALRDGGWLAPQAIISVELAARGVFTPAPGFTPLDERGYGRTRIVLLRFTP